MPKITTATDPVIEAAFAERTEFEEPLLWKRSKKNNLWRNWQGMTLTIFKREGDGYFAWSIAGVDGPRFSNCGYETEHEAIGELEDALGVGEL
jgi:hypothetical protein